MHYDQPPLKRKDTRSSLLREDLEGLILVLMTFHIFFLLISFILVAGIDCGLFSLLPTEKKIKINTSITVLVLSQV